MVRVMDLKMYGLSGSLVSVKFVVHEGEHLKSKIILHYSDKILLRIFVSSAKVIVKCYMESFDYLAN